MHPPGTPEFYRVRDLLVDVEGASVSRQGERILLPPRTFELLVALVRHYPCTVRRPELLDAVWPDETVTDQTLSHRVMVLRKALGDHAEEPAYVAGERGFGYRLVAPVERVCPEEAGPAAARPRAEPRVRRRLVRLAGAGAVLLALAVVAGGVVWRWQAGASALRAPPSNVAAPREGLVLPAARLDRLCLRGEFFFLSFSEEGLRRSAEAWEQAVRLAPEEASVHAGQALTAGVRALLDHVSPAEAGVLARRGAGRALELDPALPAGQLATSLNRLLFDWDANGAAAAARAAVEADREDARGPIVLALALQGQGRLEESERVLEEAALDDPYSAATAFLEGRAHQMRARWGEAITAYTRALTLEPDFAAARRGSAECLAGAGRRKQALVALGIEVPGRDAPDDTLRAAWRRLCLAGRTSAETVRACVLAGDAERAERLLGAAVDGRSPFVVLTPHEALLQPLRERPVLRALSARLQQATAQ